MKEKNYEEKILNELEKRTSQKTEYSDILGAEIKNGRLKCSMTLKEVAKDICSLSYLCKIENNMINPNPTFILKLCERVEISEDDLKVIYSLENYLKDIVIYFYHDNIDAIRRLYEETRKFDNHRSHLIAFMYYVIINSFRLAYVEYDKLSKIMKSLTDSDLLWFGLFKGILDIKKYDYYSGVIILQTILNRDVIDEAKILAKEYLLEAYYKANSRRVLLLKDEILDDYQKDLKYDKYEKTLFLLAKYFILNDIYNCFITIKKKLENTKYSQTIEMMDRMYNFKPLHGINEDKLISHFYKYLYTFFTSKKKYELIKNNVENLLEDEALYLRYLESKELDDDTNYNTYSKELIDASLKINCFHVIEKLKTFIENYYMSKKRYKDAISYSLKCERRLNQLKRI